MPMPIPTNAHPAMKSVNFWITPAIHRIVQRRARTIELAVGKNNFSGRGRRLAAVSKLLQIRLRDPAYEHIIGLSPPAAD